MVGSGIFALPAAFERATGSLGALIAWAVAGVYAPGTLLFVIARCEQGKPLFTRIEWLLFGVVVAVAIGALFAPASGDISI